MQALPADDTPRLGPVGSIVVGLILAAAAAAIGWLGSVLYEPFHIWAWLILMGAMAAAMAATSRILRRVRPNMLWTLAVTVPLCLAASAYLFTVTWPWIAPLPLLFLALTVGWGLPATDWTHGLPMGKSRRGRA